MKKYVVGFGVVIAFLVAARLCLYTVDAAEYAYVTVLGHHPDWGTYDGADPVNGAGLKVGWPWPIHQVLRLDRRLQQFDLDELEVLTPTRDGKTIDKNLKIDAYVCWKIADRDAVDRFVRRIGTADRARAILSPRIHSQLGAEVGKMHMDDLINTADDPKSGAKVVDVAAGKLRERLFAALQNQVRDEYGIELIDIRLRRFNHPANVRESILQRIRSERDQRFADYDSDGRYKASVIASETEAKVLIDRAAARAAEEKIKAEADMEAMKIRNEAYSQDKEFYAYLKKMENLQSILGNNKTTLLMSTHRPMFESLLQPPRPKAEPAPAPKKKEEK